VQLALRGEKLSPARLRSIDLELGRAALAVEDLADPRTGARVYRHTEAVDVGALLADSVGAWSACAEGRKVTLEVRGTAESARVLGDRLRLAQATGNLLANAIEHGGGDVEVRARAEGTRVKIEVTDSGPGLPAPVAELARGAVRGNGTRGRGLAIASAIADSHGGRLAAAPCESGARLVLELPLVRAGQAVAQP
jgi:signal transduction histidine kinase